MHERGRGDLILDKLSFAYPPLDGEEQRNALSNLSLLLGEGRRGVLLGPADAGKSTLCRILGGLVPRFTGGILSGQALFQGMDLLATSPYDGIDARGLVFQDPDEQIFTTRCDTEAAFGLESLGIERRDMEGRVAGALELMGLNGFEGRNPGTLSGGEKKRLMIACLAALRPRLWILDEVFQELDAGWKAVLIEHLRDTENTALFLDSRWDPMYGRGFEQEMYLTTGGNKAAEHMAIRGRERRLAQEGMVIPQGLSAGPMPAAGPSLIRLEGVSFRFGPSGTFQLEVDELEFAEGSVCALLGRNGSGKTTLGRLLCGLLEPDAGAIFLRGPSGFRRAAARELHGQVGYLFQNPDCQVFLPTVNEELAFGLRAAGRGEKEISARVGEALRLFGLPRGNVPPSLMSYGARKRLQAATYYLLRRRVLVLDEIDSGLSYGEIIPLLELLRGTGAALVLITHDAELARHVANRIVVIDSGRISRDLPRERFEELPAPGGGPG